jgi:hypothetical protein
MQDEISRLRGQAGRAVRLASLATDAITRDQLVAYAHECTRQADVLETAVSSGKDLK